MSCAASQDQRVPATIAEHPDDESFPGLLLLRPEGPILFANAAQIVHKIGLVREAQPKVVAVEASGVLDMEYTSVKMLHNSRRAEPA
jgi:SulP family sulfate permease